MTTYTHAVGDIEYDINVDGGDVFIEHIYVDLGLDPEDLYFIDKTKPAMKNGSPVMKSLADYMKEVAYDKFLDEWGSVKYLDEANYGDMKHEESKYED